MLYITRLNERAGPCLAHVATQVSSQNGAEHELMAAADSDQSAKQGKTYDYLFKLVLIGDYDVGKQELIKRFVDGYFQGKYVTNVAVDLRVKTVEIDGKRIKLQLWDTVGNERFRSLTSAYFRGHGSRCSVSVRRGKCQVFQQRGRVAQTSGAVRVPGRQ